MLPTVAAFTDTYLPTVNGVTYTISAWRDRWREIGGQMDVVYPGSTYDPSQGEFPVRALPFPFYDGYWLGLPQIPEGISDVDIVHSHTPFTVGYAGYRLSEKADVPLVVSYHTPTSEYADYLAPVWASGAVSRLSLGYESWYLSHADVVLTPSESTAEDVREITETSVEAVPNGVDISFFEPVETESFERRYAIPGERPLVGYTGRHGFEKNLDEILAATEDLDVTVVFGGDGPARKNLERRAEELGTDAIFLGFLDREELPAFYSTIDVFAFPSPVETQGLVALEANACGTPVVGVNSGALSDTIEDGLTGYHYEPGDVDGFRENIERAFDDAAALEDTCLERREEISLSHSIERLESVYERVLE